MINSNSLKKMYPIFIIIFGLVICSVLIFTKPEAKPEEIKRIPPIVQTESLSPESISMSIVSQGTVIPRTESQIYPEITGRVIYVSPKLYEGSSFKKGDVLLKIDPKDYELSIKTAEANLAAAKTNYSIAKAESESAKEEWDKIGSGKATDLTLKKPQLAQAKSAVEAAEADLERLNRNLEKTEIKAPYDGLVRKKNIDIGTVIAPGYLLASVYATDYIEVKLPIPDEDLIFLDIPLDGSGIDYDNQPIVFFKGIFGGKEIIWEGSIVRMEAEIDPKNRMAILIGRVSEPYDISKHEIPLRVGQFVEAEIVGKKFKNIYKINRDLIRNNNEVAIIDKADSTIDFKTVNIIRYIDDIAFIDKGISSKTPICLTTLDAMYKGMKVQLK